MKFASLALVAILASPPMAMMASPAAAQTQTDCATEIANLQTAAGSVAISGKNAEKDREGLLKPITAASTELGKGKNADAAKKLADFKIKVQQLADATRISNTDAAALLTQADAAIACVNGTAQTETSSKEQMQAAREIA